MKSGALARPAARAAPPLQTKPRDGRLIPPPDFAGQLATAPSLVHQVVRSPGEPLDPLTRSWMERRFDRDFSSVRVHADPSAAESADQIAAHAYTAGSDIAFAAGRYRPASTEGRVLLAHELTHVVQQGSAAGPAAPSIQRNGARIFGAGEQMVRIEGGVITVNGQAIEAIAGADGSLTFRGREIVFDSNGVFRYRDTGLPCQPCNPQYYEPPRWTVRSGTAVPERASLLYDTRTGEWVSRSPPVVERGVARGGVSTEVPPADIDPRLAEQVREASRIRTEFETRVQTAMDQGGLARADAEAIVRERMQPRVEGEPAVGQLEGGETIATSRERTTVGPGVERRSTTHTAARQSQTSVAVTEVPSATLETHVAGLNSRLGTNFQFNRQTLNHAEIRQVVLHPDRDVIYVDRAMCPQCQRTLVIEAWDRGRPIYVVDPETTRVFTPDRRVVEVSADTVYARRAAISTDAAGVTRIELGDHPDVVHSARPRTGTGTAEGETGRPPARPVGEPEVPERVPGSTAEPTTRTPVRTTAPEPEVGRVGVAERIGPAQVPEVGPTGAGTRGRGLRLGRAVGRLAGSAALAIVELAVLVAQLIIELIVIPWLERLQREIEEAYRLRLEEQVRRDFDRWGAAELARRLYCLLAPIRAIEARGGHPHARVDLRIFFSEAWTLFSMSQEERMQSILNFDYSHLTFEGIEVVDGAQPASAGEFRASEEEGWSLLSGSYPLYEQTMTFSLELPTSAEIEAEFAGQTPPSCSACFIATACYGSEDAPEVETLRRFRDRCLMPYAPGRLFVRFYYAASPPVADWIRPRPWARRAVRLALVGPVVALVRRSGLDGARPPHGELA